MYNIIANTGDSKAILFQFKDTDYEFENESDKNQLATPHANAMKNENLASCDCTVDHNFDVDSEYRRIMSTL